MLRDSGTPTIVSEICYETEVNSRDGDSSPRQFGALAAGRRPS